MSDALHKEIARLAARINELEVRLDKILDHLRITEHRSDRQGYYWYEDWDDSED